MANDFGDNFDEAIREAEGLRATAERARQTIQQAAVQAQRLGQELRIPTPGAPRATPIRDIPQEVTRYEGLTKAIEANERALRRLNDLRGQAKPLQARNVGDLSLNERRTLQQLETQIRAAQRAQQTTRGQVNFQRTGVATAIGGTEQVNEVETKRIYDSIRSYVKHSLAEEVAATREAAAAKVAAERDAADARTRTRAPVVADDPDGENAAIREAERRQDALVRQYEQEFDARQERVRRLAQVLDTRRAQLAEEQRIESQRRQFPEGVNRPVFAQARQFPGGVGAQTRESAESERRALDAVRERARLVSQIAQTERALAARTELKRPAQSREGRELARLRGELAGFDRANPALAASARLPQIPQGALKLANSEARLAAANVRANLREQGGLLNTIANARAREVGLITQAVTAQGGLDAALRRTQASLAGLETVQRRTIDPVEQATRIAGAQPPPPPPPPPVAPPPPPPFRDPGATRPRDPRFLQGNQSPFVSRGDVQEVFRAATGAQLLRLGFENAEAGVDSFEKSFARASDTADTNSARLRANRLEVSRSMSEYGAFSNEMRKHGAATTEFLTALAQGRTTIGEVGFQAAATAGKFAAWTAASVGVYGALTTVAATGRGAIDSMSGVNELQRFINDLDTGEAQEQFRALSREFNLPIATVTEAFANMGRTFGNQNDAFQATREVLLAMRVGELEVADSTRFLSAIVQGFGLTASDLPQVIDQINQAQNQFNFQIRDGVAGISRAAGTWKAAASDGEAATETFSTLLAVMTTAQRSTGATGEVVGTALRRSAEFIGRENNRVQLRGFGIDPDQGVSQIFRQAFSQVQSGQVQGQDVTRLATALSSPQLASIIGPTLQNYQLFNRVLRETNAEASRGSASQELAIQLSSIREQAARVTTTLEQLGSALGQAGAFDALGGILTTLNALLAGATDLVSVFTQLPDPLQKSLIYGGQLYGLFRLLRRFSVGESLTAAAGASDLQRTVRRPFGTFTQRGGLLGQGLANDPIRQRLREASGEQDNLIKSMRAEREALAAATGVAARDAARATANVQNLSGRGVSQRDLSALGAVEAQRRFTNELNAARAIEDDLVLGHQRQRDLLRQSVKETTYLEDRMTRVARIGRRDPARAIAELENDRLFPVPGTVRTFERPASELVTPFSAPTTTRPATRAGSFGADLAAEKAARGVVEDATRVVEREAIAGAEAGVAAAAGAAGRTNERAGRLRGIGRTATAGMARAATTIRGLGTALLGFFGPFEAAFLGLMFLPDIIEGFSRRAEERKAEIERFNTPTLDENEFRRQLEEADKAAADHVEQVDKRNEAIKSSNQRERQQAALQRVDDTGAPPAESELQQAQINFASREDQRRVARAIARKQGRPEPFRFLPDIQSSLEQDIAALQRGDRDSRSALDLYGRYHEAIARSMEAEAGSRKKVSAAGQALREAQAGGDPAEIERAQAEFDLANQARDRFQKALRALDTRFAAVFTPQEGREVFRSQRLAELATSLQQQAGLMEQFGASRRRLRTSATAYVAAIEKFRSASDPAAVLDQIEAAEQAFSAGIDQVATRFSRRFQRADNPEEATQAFNGSLDELRATQNQLEEERRVREREEAEALRRRNAARRQLADARRSRGGLDSGLGRVGTDLLGQGDDAQAFGRSQRITQLRAAYRKAQGEYQKAAQNAKSSRAALRSGERAIAEAEQKIIEEYLGTSERISARQRLSNAQTSNPVTQANNNLRFARQREGAIRELLVGASGRLRQTLITALLNAQADTAEAVRAIQEATAQRVQDQLSRMDTKSELRTLRLPESQRGAGTLSDLRDKLAYAQEHGADQDTIDQIQIQILNQEQQNAEEAKQNAEEQRQKMRENIESLFRLRRSRTDDPVKQANLDVRRDERLLQLPGLDRNERRDIKSQLNEDRRSAEQARVDAKLRKLDLEHDIERISDQQYLAGLRALERTLKRGTQARRDVHERILRFKHDMNDASTELELTPGDVKLPTLTELRRFMRDQGGGVDRFAAQDGGVPVATGGGAQTGGGKNKVGTVVHQRNNISFTINGGDEDRIIRALQRAGIAVKTRARNKRPG